MAVYTEVSDEELFVFVASYDIGNVLSISGVEEGVENTNYLLKTTKKALLPYFISVTDQKKNILYREKFLMSGMFIGNQSAMIFLGETVNLELPLTPKISSQDYIIYIGFLLNQNQFRYNQRSKLNRHL